MGLDMYLLAKHSRIKKTGTTGACGGLFPMTIATENNTMEIGYWRKNYRLDEKLTNMLFDNCEEDNCVKKEMCKGQILEIIDYAKWQLEEKDYEDGWYCDDDWKYTIKTFKDALTRINRGEQIYYEKWY